MTTKSKRSQPTKRVTKTESSFPWLLLCCSAFAIALALLLGQNDCGPTPELAHLWRAHVTEHPECRDAETGTDACAECHR